MKRTIFILVICGIIFSGCAENNRHGTIMTVSGPVSSEEIGITLTHEHILVDFIGADKISESRWDKNEVVRIALPYLLQIKKAGCNTFIECTPDFLGRDPVVLKSLADSLGMHFITNTGYYGVRNNIFLPAFAHSETADQLAQRWIGEFEKGIYDTGIRPGFIKIGVDNGSLSDIHKKLVVAAARAHLKTGLSIASHTGPALPAFEQVDILEKEGVSPRAFIWVHAQSEKDLNNHLIAARKGVWISLDGLSDRNIEIYVKMISNLKDHNLLNKILLSHDAGWYRPGEENGGNFRGFTDLFEKLIPRLKEEQFSDAEIRQLIAVNPSKAFELKVRRSEN